MRTKEEIKDSVNNIIIGAMLGRLTYGQASMEIESMMEEYANQSKCNVSDEEIEQEGRDYAEALLGSKDHEDYKAFYACYVYAQCNMRDKITSQSKEQ